MKFITRCVIAALLGLAIEDSALAVPGALSADFNGDNCVDHLDLVKWNESFGPTGGADANKDGRSNGFDFVMWQRQLGSTTPASDALHNPEPATIIVWTTLAGVAGLGLAARRRREARAA